jgi:hypothetical protein
MSSAKDTAEAFFLTLGAGLVPVEEVMTWADRSIGSDADPSAELIDLSLSSLRGKAAVVSCLSAMPGTANPRTVSTLALRQMHRALLNRADRLRRITRLLERMYLEGQYPDEAAASRMAGFDDELSLAELGIAGDVGSVRVEVLAFLERFVECDAA